MATLVIERYEIKKTVGRESVTVFVEINNQDEVTVQTHDSKPQFVFTRSKANRVKAMGLALQEAAELVELRKIKAA